MAADSRTAPHQSACRLWEVVISRSELQFKALCDARAAWYYLNAASRSLSLFVVD